MPRLQQLSLNQQQRLPSETQEERVPRLQQLSLNQQQRLASETPEERAAWLEQLVVNQQQRLASETPEERAARLQQLVQNQQVRLCAENRQQREVRLQRDRIHHRNLQTVDTQLPLLHQPRVHSKMANFHLQLAQLQVLVKCMSIYTLIQQFYIVYFIYCILESGEYSCKESIACKTKFTSFHYYADVLWFIDAAKKYHEYLVRQEKTVTELQRVQFARNNRILQRRQRVCRLFKPCRILFTYIFFHFSCMKGVWK